MSEIIEDLKNLVTRLENDKAVLAAEADLKALGKATVTYIESNGLAAVIAIAKGVLTTVEAGASFGSIVSSVESQAVTAGLTIAKGAAGVVVAAVQADLAAIGAVNSPGTTAPVANPNTTTTS